MTPPFTNDVQLFFGGGGSGMLWHSMSNYKICDKVS